jgi:hypothetical protein
VTPLRYANRNGAGAMEQLHFESAANGTYYIVVQGVTAFDEGSFRLKVFQGGLNNFGGGERVIINEFMANPTGADGYQEWIELYSYSSTRNFNLKDDKISLNGTVITINEDLIIRLGQVLLIGGSTDMALNGGLDSIAWGWGMQNALPDDAGTISLLAANNGVCDTVEYTSSWPITEGASLSLDPDHDGNKTDNDDVNNWCVGDDDGSPPDMTPWDFNDQCP